MTIISGPIKPVDYYPGGRQPTAAYSVSAVDFLQQVVGDRRNMKKLAKMRR